MKYFTIPELCASSIANARKIDNTPTPEVVKNLHALVDNILDPLREAWGKPIIVNSGYRSPALNKAVKGATKSDHLTGRAADITTGSKAENKKLYDLCVALDLPYRQLINEKADYSWLHVSYNPSVPEHRHFPLP